MGLVDHKDKKRPKTSPLERPDYMEADLYAVRALQYGSATADQQKRALDFILKDICGTYDTPFRPGDQHLTSLACGKQLVGQTIVYFLNSAPSKLDPRDVDATRAPTGEQAP